MIETPRLRLRRVTKADFEPLFAIWSDPRVQAGLITRPQTREEFLPVFEGHVASPRLWAIEERASGALIGRCGFFTSALDPGLELAYLLAADAWGKGYASEAVRGALTYAFDELKQPRVVAIILPDNVGSLAVARKFGFAYERDVELRGMMAQLHARARQ